MALLNIYEPGQAPAPHQDEEQDLAVGIDLGTTNSLVAFVKNNKPEILANKDGKEIFPSIVAIDQNNQLTPDYQNNSEKIYSIKRLMGKGSKDLSTLENLPFNIKKSEEQIKILLGGKEFLPIEISAEILKNLKNIAEENLGRRVSKAVITVPAYFDEEARNATKQAATLANLQVLRLVSEPTAAALAYGLDKNPEGIFAVFDLGGGTFDISILKLSSGVFKVIGVGGNSSLGGDDFDNLILEKIITKNNLQNLSIDSLQRLKLAAKNIKEQLTTQKIANISIEINHQKIDFSLSQNDFADFANDLACKTINITNGLMEELDLEIDQIQFVILVGGSTRMPIVKNKLIKNFGFEKILDNIDPDKIVALGAAIQADALSNKNSDNLLLDVTPLSLGIEMMGGLVEKIIERNSTIPTSASKEFTTYADGQNGMRLHIVQGERELAKDCRSLANFEIKNIPALKAGVARVRVVFEIDADGLLRVSATEQSTNLKQTIDVKPTYGLEDSQIKNILLESLKNSKEDMQNRLLVESKVEAQRNILALEAAISENPNFLDQTQLAEVQNQIKKLNNSIQNNDKNQIDFESEKLEQFAAILAEKKMNQEVSKTLIGKKIDEI